jgi:protein-tyrosine-phosphatase
VRELTALVEEPQNLVSYHLRQLHDGGLVVRHRSSADRRDVYYAVDLPQCRDELASAARALHPALWPDAPPPSPKGARRERLLFLCTGNSARSQIAEALTVHLSDGRITAASAGSNHVDRFRTRKLDVVITLCDRVREVCPEFSAHPAFVHWSIPDPATSGATDRETYPAFERTAAELETRITYLTRGTTHA